MLRRIKELFAKVCGFSLYTGACSHCGTSYNDQEFHSTSIGGIGMFVAVCEPCWKALSKQPRNIAALLKAYKTEWIKSSVDSIPWEVLRVAVIHEQPPKIVSSLLKAKVELDRHPEMWVGIVMQNDQTIMLIPQVSERVIQAWEEQEH